MIDHANISLNIKGRWLDTATADNLPDGSIEWHGIQRRAYSAMVGKRCVGAIRYRRVAGGWTARLAGWMWEVTDGMGSARFGIKETPVKYFESREAAQKELEHIWSTRPI